MDVRDRVWRAIDEAGDRVWTLALQMHENPELSFEEHKAAAWLTQVLAEGGFDVQRGVAGLPTAFRAVHPANSEGPRVAILAEYDALVELGHACGHNLIAGIAIGAALGLAPFKDHLPGQLMVIGCPAEEGGGGKVTEIRHGLFQDLDAAMMVHPASYTIANWGSLAKVQVEIAFLGRAAHASSEPEKGVNALDAVLQTIAGLNALRQHIRDGSRIHGIISDGGTRPDTVPEHAAARFYVRAAGNVYCDELVEKLRRCAEGAALATGAELRFQRIGIPYKAMKTNLAMAGVFERYMTTLGYSVVEPQAGLISTDMGDVSWEVPSIHAYVEIADDNVPVHSREFAEAARSKRGREGMLAAAKAVAATCLDLWSDPTLYQQVREEFDRRL